MLILPLMLRLPLHAPLLLLAPTAIKCSFFTCCSYSLLPIMLNFCYLFFLPFRLLFRLYHPLSPPAPTHIICSSSKCSVVQILCPSCQMLFCPIYFCPRWQMFMFFCCPKVLCYGPEAYESCFVLFRIICKMKLLKCL